jgi:hypothetical protein
VDDAGPAVLAGVGDRGVTLPVPASTDPAGDAYQHIGALADAITAKLSSRSVAYWAGVVVTDGSGDFAVPGISGVLSYCTGAIVTDAAANPTTAAALHLYRVMSGGPPGTARVRVYTYLGAGIGAAALGVSVVAFGTPA